jgi:hypothetical protein
MKKSLVFTQPLWITSIEIIKLRKIDLFHAIHLVFTIEKLVEIARSPLRERKRQTSAQAIGVHPVSLNLQNYRMIGIGTKTEEVRRVFNT